MKKVDYSSWKEFRIGDMFDVLPMGMKKETFEKAQDVSLERTEVYTLPLVNAKHGNNGIMYYGREIDFDSAEMTIDIVADGASATGDVYPQPQKTGVLYNAYLIKPHKFPTLEELFFYACVIQKTIKQKYGYNHKATWGKVKEEMILLPTTDKGEIDYRYMEDYIRGVEVRAKKRLALLRSIKPSQTKVDYSGWKKFKIGDLFDVPSLSHYVSKSDITLDGTIPIYSAETTNNGVIGYCKCEPHCVVDLNTPFYLIFGDHTKAFHIVDTTFCVTDNAKVLRPRHKEVTINVLLFIISVWGKSIPDLGYARHWPKARTIDLLLPVTPAGDIDYKYMEDYIRGVEVRAKKRLALLKGINV